VRGVARGGSIVDVTTPTGPAEAIAVSRAGRAAADRLEPRALRSRTRILEALREALAEASIDELTVSELSRRAGVHRVTFYGHWPDVRAAAVDAFAEVIDVIATIDEQDVAAASGPAELATHYERALAAQLAEIRDHREIYRSLTESTAFSGRLLEALTERAELAVQAMMRVGVDVPGAASGTAAAHLAGGVVAASARWARTDDDDIETATAEFTAQLPAWWPRG